MQWMDHPENQSGNSIPKKHYRPNRPNTYIEHSLQQRQDRYFYQAGREYFLEQTINFATKQVLANSGRLKLHQISFLTTVHEIKNQSQQESWKTHDHMQIK